MTEPMSDESPYRPIRITIPDDHPMFITDGFRDILAEYYASLTPVKPVEPIKLTQEQLDAVRVASEPVLPGAVPPPILGTPIIIVERIEDSTPYQRRLEALKRLAKEAMRVPFPMLSQPPQRTVLVAESHEQCTRWCWENHRNPRDPNIIRITDGFRDQYRLQGLTDFEVVVLDPCRGYDEVMAFIKTRQCTVRRG